MIKTRFSPSPTGLLHLGNVRAALFSALYAKQKQGHYVLRIEDTDAVRSEERFADILQQDLKWLGLIWDEGPGIGGPNAPYLQSQRHEIYVKYYKTFEEKHLAYPCFCSDQELALNRKLQLSRGQPPRYPGTCRGLSKEEVAKRIAEGKKPALRFRVPENKKIEFVDLVKGLQHFNSSDIGDFIIRRAEGTASFMFCNAIDDALMQITHVLRGEDHLANTPRQLMLMQALNLHSPQYGHLSLIVSEEGDKLSKRGGSFSLHELSKQGYLPIAVINYLARLSHAYSFHHLMSFDELATNFNLEKISRSSARFDENQLLHWQKEAVMALEHGAVWHWLGEKVYHAVPSALRDLFIEAVRPNISFPQEADIWLDILFGDGVKFTAEQVSLLQEIGVPFYTALLQAEDRHGADLKCILSDLKEQLKISGKKLFMPVRLALTGQEHGPELLQIVGLLGREKMRQRFEYALDLARKVHVKDL